MNNVPFVSVIIPCRNEEKYLSSCLDSILSNDYPKDRMEVLIVDGASKDRTREIALQYCRQNINMQLLENPQKIVPTGMNTGIKSSRGEIIIRMDAHTIYSKDYIWLCVKHLRESGAENVGGIWVTKPGARGVVAESIALALSAPFGVGNARFRTGTNGPRYVDTVPFGCYNREIFDKVGLFNEKLVRNQDIELNLRIRRNGGRILLFSDIVSFYHARSTLKGLFGQNFRNGLWVTYSTNFAKTPFSLRHLVPLIFVSALFGSAISFLLFPHLAFLFLFVLGSYLAADFCVSLKLARKKRLDVFLPLLVAFPVLHFSYGFGSLWGILKTLRARLSGHRLSKK
jgi:glycosyltransferase involved in cell wall biosynthesis